MTGIVPVVLAITVILVLVSVLLPLADRWRLPHVVLIAALGLGIGLVSLALDEMALQGVLRDAVQGLASLELPSEAFLFLFLPVLLFTVGLSSDMRRLLDDFAVVLLLAVVAIAVCTAFVGYSLAAVSGVGLTVCLLIGSMIATTDPAAVVAVFRDLGAPRRLTALVEGESLFNDAAAIALFALLLSVLDGSREPSLAEGLAAFLYKLIGGAAVGFALGRAVVAILPWLREALVAEITLSVALAYFSFIVGEHYFHVSGVVAVVVAALTFAAYGPTRLTPANWEGLVATWKQLEFWANSLIFVLAAALAARVMSALTAHDLLMLAVVIAAALAARAFTLYVLLPGLTALRLTEPVAPAHKIVILWGGLRGAVTMVLAFAAVEHPALPEPTRHFVGVLSLGFVLFTLFIGAPTLRPLLRILGLDQLSPAEAALRDRVMALSQDEIDSQLDVVAREYRLDRPSDRRAAEDAAAPFTDPVPLFPGDQVQVGLLTLVARERELCYQLFRERTISRRMVRILISAADFLFDKVKTAGIDGYVDAGCVLIKMSKPFRLGLWLHRRFGWSALLERCLGDRFESLMVLQLVLERLIAYNNTSIAPLFGSHAQRMLDTLLTSRLEAMESALAAVELQYPLYTAALRHHYLKRAEIRLREDAYRQRLEESLISLEVYHDLQRQMREQRQALDRRPPLDLGLKLAEMVARVPMFASLDDRRLADVARMLRPRLAVPGERVIVKGDRGDAMYFIASGEMVVRTVAGPIHLGPGDFFGEMALLSHMPRNADVVAAGYVQLLALEGRDFRKLLRLNPDIRTEIERVAGERRDAAASRAVAE